MNIREQAAASIVASLGALLVAAACVAERPLSAGPQPVPRDLSSGAELPTAVAGTRIAWWTREPGTERRAYVRLDGEDPQLIDLPEFAVTAARSSSGRYVAYATSLLADGNIELLDVESGERRVVVQGAVRFPGATLAYPSFSQDEMFIVFEVATAHRIDLAMVELGSGHLQFLDLRGGVNKWPRISPDGAWILVGCEDQSRPGLSLCLIDQARRERRYLVEDQVISPGEFTADSQSVVYVAAVGDIHGEGQLYRVGLDGRDRRLLVSGLRRGTGVAMAGDAVAFTCQDAERPLCDWICVVGLSGGEVRRLTYLGERCIDPDAP